MTGHFDTPVLCPVKTRQKNDGTPTPTCIMSSQKVKRKMTGHFDTPVLCPVKTSQKNDRTPTPTCIMSSQKVKRIVTRSRPDRP